MKFLGIPEGGEYPVWLNFLSLVSFVLIAMGVVGIVVHQYDVIKVAHRTGIERAEGAHTNVG